MFKGMKKAVNEAHRWIYKVISSKKFFYVILAIAVIQGLWYALVFQPIIYDEGHHVLATYFFIDNVNPFQVIQNTRWDVLADMSRNLSWVFYYLLSIPLRLIKLFTSDYILQVIGLRVIMIALFVGGAVMYRKVMELLEVTPFIINLAMLSVIMLPNISVFAGVVNYDNVIFLLFPSALYFAVKIIKTTKVNAVWLLSLIALSFGSMLAKFTTALALFTPVILLVGYHLWRRHGATAVELFMRSFKKSDKIPRFLLVGLIILCVGLLIERPIQNLIKYRSFSAPCEKVLSKDRCMQNYTFKRGVDFRQVKPSSWSPIGPYGYFKTYWFDSMVETNVRMPGESSMPYIRLLFNAAAIIGSLLILINLKTLLRRKEWNFIILSMTFFVLALFYETYSAYVRLGQPVAMAGRYLLPYLPIFGAIALTSFSDVFCKNIKKLLVVVGLPVVVILLTQGGGLLTVILTQKTVWNNEFSQNLNSRTKKMLEVVIKEH